ncbi:hypothetical protein C8J57DRAFT_1459142 [Mycena rebaudengoi]|nr:hypothetical protein C8J57DRAFT_1459142 [Mycena rebaudengoi]
MCRRQFDAEKYTEHTGAVRVKNVGRREAYLKNWPDQARQQTCRNAGAKLTPRNIPSIRELCARKECWPRRSLVARLARQFDVEMMVVIGMVIGNFYGSEDISGIGVRAAIYAKIFCFLPVVAHLRDGTVSAEEMKGVKDRHARRRIPHSHFHHHPGHCCRRTADNRFHAAIILDLSWMNNTSTWIWFLLYAHYLSKADKRKRARQGLEATLPSLSSRTGQESNACDRADWRQVVFSSKVCPHHASERSRALVFRAVHRVWDQFSQAPVLILGSFHLSLMSAIGIWLWLDLNKFGTPISSSCVPTLPKPSQNPLQFDAASGTYRVSLEEIRKLCPRWPKIAWKAALDT